jgi:D-alanyl-D-alanine carboxypeptidase/D-alanyl-D-alanine-endopeptidase (penicillin-binding protein 4)
MTFPSAPCFALLLALVLPPAVLRAADPAPSVPATLAELQARLAAHVEQPRFAPALWGVKVVSLATGRVWFEHHADRYLSPASNTKLYTGALALDVLGGDYVIRTPVLATAAPDAAGVVRGDVVVSGRGDPSWKTRGATGNFWDAFAPVVAVLERAGVKRITGELVADATWFRSLPNGSGWTADDLNDDYGAEISAISIEQNYADATVTAAAEAGLPPTLALVQPDTGLTLENRLTTLPAKTPKSLLVQRVLGETVAYVSGGVPVGAKAQTVEVTVPRPAAWYAAGLKEALARRGIVVEGRTRAVRWPEKTVVRADQVLLGEAVSPPLRDLVTGFMKPSQNLETDLIFGHVAELSRSTKTPAERTTEELGVAALRAFFEREAMPAADVRFEEGSGLSRNNLTTANATVALLVRMASHREAASFARSLPIAGRDGSLRTRMQGTPAEGNVIAKTGTLRHAASLSGYVTTAAGEKLAFSLMLNRNGPQPANRTTWQELDDVAVLLASFAGRGE